MSTVKSTNLQHPDAASPNIVLAADGGVNNVTFGLFNKTDPGSVAFTKTGAGTVSIKAGTRTDVDGTAIAFATVSIAESRFGFRHDLIDQPPVQRGRRVDGRGGQNQPARAAPADQSWQQRRVNHRRNTNLDLWHRELRILRRDSQVAGRGKFKSAAEAPSAQPRDHRHREYAGRLRKRRAGR